MTDRHLRIHGDNIVECERTLNMIHNAFGGELTLTDCPVYKPVYSLLTDEHAFNIELLPGHGRWGVNIGDLLLKNGGILREGADSYISEIKGETESILLAIEYCSALPAGNNAWQRNGRALSSVMAGVPYLYMTELGGVELDGARKVKAPRYPNPLVPFSYISTSRSHAHLCMPVYGPHPSISDELYDKFESVFGLTDALSIIKGILTSQGTLGDMQNLERKTLKLIEILTEGKRSHRTLRETQWQHLLQSGDRANWIIDNAGLTWRKKMSTKVNAPDRIKRLIHTADDMKLETIGASDIPVCLIARDRIGEFENILHDIYPDTFIDLPRDKPLAVVWITGYKPKGDDSRPDRGLCPLTRMVMGTSCRVLGIVYGPAKPLTWKIMEHGVDALARNNGLWQSIHNICDGVLIDSVTKPRPEYISIPHDDDGSSDRLIIPYMPKTDIEHSEHDIDTAIHQILTRGGLAECLCNPPGGDWSGINFLRHGDIYRWTSLPRVSSVGGKRPDHVFQQEMNGGSLFISIESKGNGNDLEDGIGAGLTAYLQDLFSTVPTAIKKNGGEWRLHNEVSDLGQYSIISAGAFIYKNEEELYRHMKRGQLDCTMALEFKNPSVLHLLSNKRGRTLESIVKQAAKRISGLEVEIHRF